MSRRRPRPKFPWERVLAGLHRAGARYVLVGVDGFNQWITDPRQMIGTIDSDLCVRQDAENLGKILHVLAREGYEVFERPPGDAPWKEIVLSTPKRIRDAARRLARSGRDFLATYPQLPHTFEFLGSVTGFTFESLESDAALFDRGAVPVRVASIGKILDSKRRADRPKDRDFFRRYRLLIGEAIRAAEVRLRARAATLGSRRKVSGPRPPAPGRSRPGRRPARAPR